MGASWGEFKSPIGETQPTTFPSRSGAVPQWVHFFSVSNGLERERRAALLPSRPREFHPEPLTDPDLILSHHPARAINRRLPPSVEFRVPPVTG